MSQGWVTCISSLTFLATVSGWSLANLSKVAKKFLHFTLAVSGVICWPMPPGPPPAAADAGGAVTGAVGSAGGAEAAGGLATGWVGSLMGGEGAAAGGAACLTTVA